MKPEAKDDDAVAGLQRTHPGLGAWCNAKTHNPSAQEQDGACNPPPTHPKNNRALLRRGPELASPLARSLPATQPPKRRAVPAGPGSRSPSLPASSREMLLPPQPSASPSDESAPAPSPNLILSPVPGGFPGHVRNMKDALLPCCRLESWRRGEDCSGSA